MRHLWLVFVAILVPAFAGCADESWLTTRLHVVAAEQGVFAETDEPGIYTLTLNGASDAVGWFTDWPSRGSGIESFEDFSMSTWQQVLTGESPVGAITYQDADGYWSMAPVKALGLDAGSETEGVTWRLELKGVPDPGTLRDVHLYLDDRGESETEEGVTSVFIHGAASVSLEPQDNSGAYTLRLAYPYPSVSVMQTDSDFAVYQMPIATYIDAVWSGDFMTNPPNAAIQLEGLDGVTYVAIAVLSNPAYDSETNELTYDAELLSGDPVVTSGPGAVFIDDWTDDKDTIIYRVLINPESQYSVYPADKLIPTGWADTGKTGTLAECRDYIIAAWSDMRPVSLAAEMVEMAGAVAGTRAKMDLVGKIAVITIQGRIIDDAGCQVVEDALGDGLAADIKQVVMDLGGVTTINSYGVAELIRDMVAVRQALLVRLALANVSEPVMEVLVDSQVAPLFQFYDTLTDALAALGG